MSRVVAKGLENRRHMIIRSLERHIFQKILERNEGRARRVPEPGLHAPSGSRWTSTPTSSARSSSCVTVATSAVRPRWRSSTSTRTSRCCAGPRSGSPTTECSSPQTPFSSPVSNPYGAPGGQQPPNAPPSGQPGNVGPSGQPRTEGGRPSGVKEETKRAPRGSKA